MAKGQTMRQRHKFHAQPTTCDGIKFASKKEARRYRELQLGQEQSGPVLFFLRQVPFDLPGNVKYRVDFQIFWRDGSVSFEDVKGHRTKDFIMKKKMVEALYPVKIEER
jgi:hypothetical protein